MQFFLLERKETRDLLPFVLFFYQIEMIDNVFIGIEGTLVPKVSILYSASFFFSIKKSYLYLSSLSLILLSNTYL